MKISKQLISDYVTLSEVLFNPLNLSGGGNESISRCKMSFSRVLYNALQKHCSSMFP